MAVDAFHYIGGPDVALNLRRAIDDGEALLDILLEPIREWFKKYLLMTCRTQILGDVAGEILEQSRIKRITPETKALAKEVRAELKVYEEFGNEFYALQKDMPCGFMYETGWISIGKTPLK